jgi:hypothetical protein
MQAFWQLVGGPHCPFAPHVSICVSLVHWVWRGVHAAASGGPGMDESPASLVTVVPVSSALESTEVPESSEPVSLGPASKRPESAPESRPLASSPPASWTGGAAGMSDTPRMSAHAVSVRAHAARTPHDKMR